MQTLIIALFSAWFASISGIPQMVSQFIFLAFDKGKDVGGIKRPYRLKPLDCELCLAFWISFFTNLDLSLIQNILLSGVCSLIAMTYVRLYNNLPIKLK